VDQQRHRSKLIEKCINWTKEKGARIIYTETGKNNEKAIRFYQKNGFQITGYLPDYYQEGLDAVILVNKLKGRLDPAEETGF